MESTAVRRADRLPLVAMNRQTLIAKLKEDLLAGRVVTITGTGVSVAACGNQEVEGFKVATWTGLLQHGVKHCQDIGVADEDDVEILSMQIRKGKTDILITAAETISQRMKAKSDGVFRGWLKDTVGKLKIKDRDLLDAVAALPGVLATLNYDHLLGDATGRASVTWLKPDDTQDVLTRVVTDAVIHLHGWYREPESVVLGLSSYLAVKDHPHAKAVLELFTTGRTLLFIGCGDTVLDPNFSRLIEWGTVALDEVSPRHYLLCRTAEIADFQTKLVNAPWLQPLDYGADYSELVPFLRGLVPVGGVAAPKSDTMVGPGFDLAVYRQAMRKKYSRLKLEELDPTTHDLRPLTLTGMFIEQSARECVEFLPRVFELPKELQQRLRRVWETEAADTRSPQQIASRVLLAAKSKKNDNSELDVELIEEHRRAYLEQSPRAIIDIVSDLSLERFVVLGDPGSGKSTLLQFLLLRWAEMTERDFARERLPILIELREYARLRAEGTVHGFLEFLNRGESVRCHLNQAQLESWLKTNSSLVLFDGLDEVFDSGLRFEISTAIHRFADEYRLARIIVTSRIIGYQYQAWRDEGFRHFMLQELDESQIETFLTRWHRTAYEELAQGEKQGAGLVRAIADSVAIRQLAGNPLLLTMMSILNRTQELPRDRAELYEQCARLLLHQWKVDEAFSNYPELAQTSLDFKDKRGLLLRVARAMQSSKRGLAGNLIDETKLETTLEDGLKGIPNLRPDRAARALIEQLRGRNFMLCSVGGRSYAFVHRTFLEYFCAVEIRERFQTEQSLTFEQLKTEIYGHWEDETWHEVLCLLAGMLAPRFVTDILRWLLARPDPKNNRQHVFLAALCVGEVRKRGTLGDVEREIRDCTKALTRFGIGYSYNDNDAEIRSRATITLAAVWRNLPETRIWLQENMQSELHPGVQQIALQDLARAWKDYPETLPWLKSLLNSGGDESLRSNALRELARNWKDEPETSLLLKNWAQTDGHYQVRRVAVQELARIRKGESETATWIKAQVWFDENPFVRQAVVEELASGWKDDPETLIWLKDKTQSDVEPAVRQTAVQELGRVCKGEEPETLGWLKARIECDEHWLVRLAAVDVLSRCLEIDSTISTWLKSRVQVDKDYRVHKTIVRILARCRKGDLSILSWLQVLTQCNEHWAVREVAVEELAQGWRGNSETLPCIKAIAEFDEDYRLRLTALRELVRGWKDFAETYQILIAKAQSDDSWAVRKIAVEELSRGWRGDIGTLSIFKIRVISDESCAVRKSLVEELARGWHEHPETLPILKARAQSDEDYNVRLSAVEELARGWEGDAEVQSFLGKLGR